MREIVNRTLINPVLSSRSHARTQQKASPLGYTLSGRSQSSPIRYGTMLSQLAKPAPYEKTVCAPRCFSGLVELCPSVTNPQRLPILPDSGRS